MNIEDIEIITWFDHNGSDGGWYAVSGFANSPSVIRSVGWVILENDDCVTIVQSGNINEEIDLYNGAITIVKGAIIERWKPFEASAGLRRHLDKTPEVLE